MAEEQIYKVKVNNELNFSISNPKQELSILDLADNTYHLIVEHQSMDAKVTCEDFNSRKYKVEIFDKSFTVYIGNPLDDLIETLGLETKEIIRVDELNAPMPGLIMKIEVGEGDEVEEGQVLLILEAMKMENAIVSPRSGRIKQIAVKENQAVEKNQLLIEFEKPE